MNKDLTPLEVFEELKSFLSMSLEFKGVDKLFVNGSLNIIEKSLKALEIISFKKVDVIKLGNCFEMRNGYDFYNQGFIEIYKLTKEEYDLLKEALL